MDEDIKRETGARKLRARWPALVSAVAATLAVSACGGARASVPLLSGSAPAVASAPAPPHIGEAGYCQDGTLSVDPAAQQAAVTALVSFVASWPPAAGDHEAGTAPVPALSLKVRKVMGQSSIGLEGQVADVEIPAVPGVIPKPAITDPNYIDGSAVFQAQAVAFDKAVAPGGPVRAAADAGANRISHADWSAPESEIAGCFEGLARTTSGPNRRLAALTDLDQNQAPQQGAADLSGATILVFHVGTDVKRMKAQEDAFKAQWKAQGAVDVQFAAPETIAQLLPAFFRTGRTS